jgi:hypothetical protein
MRIFRKLSRTVSLLSGFCSKDCNHFFQDGVIINEIDHTKPLAILIMSETPLTPSEKTVVVNTNPLCRLWTLVFVSLGLNGLILLVLLIGFLCHHHRHYGSSRFADYGDRGASFCMMGEKGFGHHFHSIGGHKFGMGPGYGRPDGFGREEEFRGIGPMGMMRGENGRGMGMEKNGSPSPADMTDKILNHLSNRLSLTDDQKIKLRPVIEQQVTQMQKDMEAQRQAMQKLMEETKAKVKPILNADQQKQLDQIKLPGQQNPSQSPSSESHP